MPGRVIVVASANGDVGMAAAIVVLRDGGSALDAVESATREVELNVADHSVGVGGYPNALGEVELDASIMDGDSRRAGAVAGLKGYANPVSVARSIMEKLPQHLLLVGDGAARWAREQGFSQTELLTEAARRAWQEKVARTAKGEMPIVESAIGTVAASDAGRLNEEERDLLRIAAASEHKAGTVNFIARGSDGRIASAVSTSGWAFKYPGRAGDSPIIGAGNYCDSRHGACCCTGLGEWAIRAGTARTVVLAMQLGRTLDEAAQFAMEDLRAAPLPSSIEPTMNLIAIDRDGGHVGYSTLADRKYVWQTAEMDEFATEDRKTCLGRSVALS